MLGDLGLVELLILVIILVILFYPSRMKDIVKNFGIAVKAFKEGAREVEEELKDDSAGKSKKKR